MKAQHPLMGEWFYFIDKCLPFGASISCVLFQRFSNALCHVMEYKTKTQGQITNYLDDFLFLALTIVRCNYLIDQFIQLYKDLGVPISFDKTEWASHLVIFLGILLDGRNFCLGIPREKQRIVVQSLETMIDKRKTMVHELQSLCGYPNFLSKVIFPGRTFTCHMYAKYSMVVNVKGIGEKYHQLSNLYKMKQHYHVTLDREFKKDCQVWLDFLTGDTQSVINRLMVDLLSSPILTADQIQFYSDASASKRLGFGCILNDHWIQGFWVEEFITLYDPSIEFLELYALVAGIFTWQNENQLQNCRVRVFCDNQAVVQMINNLTSSCPKCMTLIRMFVLNGLKYNRRVTAVYIDTKSNFLADTLS